MTPSSTTPEQVAAAWGKVRARIGDAGGDPERVRVVAVTKGQSAAAAEAARAAGIGDLGESYAQELEAKAAVVAEVRWHFVGRIQRNKVRKVAPLVVLWHGVDRADVGAEIARRAPGAAVLAQVNVTGEANQGGCAPADTPALVRALSTLDLDVRGLMAVGARGGADAARPGFRRLTELADELELPERSMGMSADLEAAVAEGATLVRVGTALFGPRPGPPGVGK